MIPEELLNALAMAQNSPSENLRAKKLESGGLINHSYRLNSDPDKTDHLLQQINTSVFKKPEDLDSNYKLLFEFSQSDPKRIRIPTPLIFPDGKTLFKDNNGNTWRANQWISGTCTLDKVETIDQAEEVARTFALFTRSLSKGFATEKLKTTLPRFHDLGFRYQQFEEALQQATTERVATADSLPDEMKTRISYCHFFENMQREPVHFPQRVMHHDAKISNILFEEDRIKVWGPIDLDTVMPGYYFSDLGDMIRSLTGSIDENNKDFSTMHIREDIYERLVDTYSGIMEEVWTEAERENKHACGLLLVYMQTLRFLADHLNGDIYYQVKYSGQNLERALNQFQLLLCLENYLNQKHGYKI